MLVRMKRQVFDSLDPAVLAWECIGPIALPLRGKHPTLKSQAYAQLTAGQQALFVVQVFYNYAGQEAAELYCWVSTLQRDPQAWAASKAGVCYFGDDGMLHLLEQIESVLEAWHHQGETQQRDPLPWDLDDDPELCTSLSQLNATFHQLAQTSLKLMGAYIRKHPSEFVLIEEEEEARAYFRLLPQIISWRRKRSDRAIIVAFFGTDMRSSQHSGRECLGER